MSDRQTRLTKRKRSRFVSCFSAVVLGLAAMIVLVFLAYFVNNRPVSMDIPSSAMPKPNAFDDFVRAGRLAKKMTHPGPSSMEGITGQTNTFANYELCAKEFRPICPIVAKALTEEFMNPPLRSNDSITPEYADERALARTMRDYARYELICGNTQSAIGTMLDGYQMGVTVPRGGTVLALLVGRAIEAISLNGFEDILPGLTEEELAHAAKRLEKINSIYPKYSDIVREEGWFSLAASVESLNAEKALKDRYKELLQMVEAEDDKPITISQGWDMVKYTMSNKEAMLLDNKAYFDAVAKESEQPYSGPSKVKLPGNLLAKWCGIVSELPRTEYIGSRAALDLLRIAVALYRYRSSHSRFPASLTDLVPHYISNVPADRFGGLAKPSYKYKLTKGGKPFLLYSVGPDMKDDGGMPTRGPGREEAGDIVAGKIWFHRPLAPPTRPSDQASAAHTPN